MADDNTEDLIISISTDQATLRRSIKRIEQDLGTLAGSVKKQFDSVGKSVDSSTTSALQSRINAMVGVGTSAAKEWTGALADQGKELDRLRAKYSPLFATLASYKNTVAEIKRAHSVGAISANEMAAAISKERQAALASTAAIKGRNAALADTPSVGGSHGGANAYAAHNAMFQFQDIVMTAAGGMSPGMIGLQQGSQLAGGFAGMNAKDIGKTALAGVAGLLSPVSLVTVGLTAATAAAIQFFSTGSSGAKAMHDALANNAKVIELLRDQFGKLAEVSAAPGNVGGNTFILAQANKQREDLRKGMKSELSDYLSSTVNAGWTQDPLASNGSKEVARLQNLTGDQAKFADPVNKLLEGVRNGHGDLEKFNKDVDDLAQNLAKTSDHPEALMDVGDAVKALAAAGFDASGKYKAFADAFNLLKVKGVDGFSEFASKIKELATRRGCRSRPMKRWHLVPSWSMPLVRQTHWIRPCRRSTERTHVPVSAIVVS